MSLQASSAVGKGADPPPVQGWPPKPRTWTPRPSPSSDRRLSSTDKVVADALASHAPGGKSEVWPSLSRLALLVGRSRQVVRLSVRNLEHFGYLRLERDGSLRTGRRFVLLWRLPGFAPAEPEGPSPRERESRRVAARRGLSVVGAGVCNTRGVGAGVCNTIPPGVCNHTPESCLEALKERSLEEDRGGKEGTAEDRTEGEGPSPAEAWETWEPTADELRALTEANEQCRTRVTPTPEAEPANVGAAFAALPRGAGDEAVERAARLLQAEFAGTDRADSLRFYRGIAAEVRGGGLSPDAVAYALARSKRPGVRNRGAMFNATLKDCRADGGRPPEKPRPAPAPPAHRSRSNDPGQNREAVVGQFVEAVRGRAAEGMSPEANRAATLAKASALADQRGYQGAEKENLLAWAGEALAAVLDGAPTLDAAAFLRRTIPALARRPDHRAAG
jgi:hypothetical protein